MEFMYTNYKIDEVALVNLIKQLFPDLSVCCWDFEGEYPASFNPESENNIMVKTDYDDNKLEFGYKISIFRTPEENADLRSFYIAKQLSGVFKQQVLVPFTHPTHKTDPYFCILFEAGRTYLVDDSDTNFGDNSKHLIRMIEEYQLPRIAFDNKAKLLNRKHFAE